MSNNFVVRQGTVEIPNILTENNVNIVGINTDGELVSTTLAISATGVIGDAEDGDYTDGLFVDLTPSTPTGTAVDRFNEVLKALAPPPAPILDNISMTNSGVAGKLSFGTSNPISGYTNVPTLDVNSMVTVVPVATVIYDGPDSITLRGIFNANTNMTGVLNDNVAVGSGTPNAAYPADAFGDADQGTIELWVNGSNIHTVNLNSFSSGNSLNGNGSGFTSLSAATSVLFPGGSSFDIFKYRTGSWIVNQADQRLGYNRVEVRRINGSTVTSNRFGWVVDGDTTATTYSSESLSSLSMTGSKTISGVSYYTGGTATYNITISNLHRNTYSSSGTAISHPTLTNISISSSSLNNIPSEVGSESETEVIAKTATINNNRILNGSISANTRTDRTVQSDINSSGASISGLLVDNINSTSNSTTEGFDGESFRIQSTLDTTITSGYTSFGDSPSEWNSSVSLVGGDTGHNTGLLVYNSALRYPTQGDHIIEPPSGEVNNGNFSLITNGPAGNVNYSSATGNRTYYRFFYTATPKQDFRFNLTVSSTSFVNVSTGPSGNNLTFEIMAPNTTTDGIILGTWKDAVVAYTSDNAVGCYASSNGSTIPTNWGMTIGTKSTVNSGNVIVVRITASSGWTGNISNMAITWL
jgi:hypothetical protein